MVDLTGRVAVVTGAAGDIGRAAGVELARHGARVVLVDLSEAGLAASQRAVESDGGDARVVIADVASSDGVRGYVAAALDSFGSIDILFSNAGVQGPVCDLAEYPEEAFDRVIAVNLRGVFLGLRHVLPVMIEQRSGSIVNMSSIAGERGLPGTGPYNASKHGVLGLTRTAAAEAGGSGVRVNAICPGPVDTQMIRDLVPLFVPDDPERGLREMSANAPIGRLGRPEEIAALVRFLASDDASFVNGVAWAIDGGATATMRNPS